MPKSEQGVFHNRYQVIPRTLIFVTQAGRVLLLKGGPHKRLWANRYNGIGGHIERGEDVNTAARRELREETGLVPGRLWLCGTIMVDADPSTGIAIFVYRCDFSAEDALTLLPSEEGSLEWADPTQLRGLPLVEDLQVILPAVLTSTPGRPFAAHSYYDEQEKLQVVVTWPEG